MKRALLLIGTLRSLLRTGKLPVNKRRAARLTVFLCCLLVSSPALSDIRLKDYSLAKSSEWFKSYILGVGAGIRWASIRPDRLALHCPPGSFKPDADAYIAILDRQILDESRKPDGLHDDTPIELLLLRGLMRKFPCNR